MNARKLKCQRLGIEIDPENPQCPSPGTYCDYRGGCFVWMEMRKREIQKKIDERKAKLEDLRSRLPAHSVSAEMMQEIDELEEEIRKLQLELEDLE